MTTEVVTKPILHFQQSSGDPTKDNSTFYTEELAEEQEQIIMEKVYSEALYAVMHRVGKTRHRWGRCSPGVYKNS